MAGTDQIGTIHEGVYLGSASANGAGAGSDTGVSPRSVRVRDKEV